MQDMADSWRVRCVFEDKFGVGAGNQTGKSDGILYSGTGQRRARGFGKVSTDYHLSDETRPTRQMRQMRGVHSLCVSVSVSSGTFLSLARLNFLLEFLDTVASRFEKEIYLSSLFGISAFFFLFRVATTE